MQPASKFLLTTLGVATGLSLQAGAAVLYFPGQEIAIPISFAGVSVDLETGAFTNDLDGAPGADINFFLGGEGISNDGDRTAAAPSLQFARVGTGNADPAVNLALGSTVDGTLQLSSGFGASGGGISHFPTFVSGSPGYLGFSVELADMTNAYGWMRVTLQDDNTPGVIHEWAYEDTGASIQVGAIPEPSHALLVIMGLASLALRRRRA